MSICKITITIMALLFGMNSMSLGSTWSSTDDMSTRRVMRTASLLSSGNILVCGGGDAPSSVWTYLNTCEIYNTANGSWASTGSMAITRVRHCATVLPNGKVLVSGGSDGGTSLSTCELYDPTLGTWSTTGALTTAREQHTAT